MPTYIFHGTKDAVVPYASAAMLRPLLPEKDHFITIRGGGHKDLSEFELFQEKLDEILGKSF
jgi:pimeloyl-ACP methyl ester carboxylesterase